MRFRYDNMVFNRIQKVGVQSENYVKATYKGVALKTVFFLAMVVLGAVGGLFLAVKNPGIFFVLLGVGLFSTFVLAIVSMISLRACKITGTLYCLFEGLSIGILSLLCAMVLQGAVTIAILSTITVFAVVAVLFVGNVVKVNSSFMRFLTIFAISYLVSILIFSLLSLFNVITINWGFTLGACLVTVFLATLYLFFDLENIRQVVEGGYPKEYEWTAAFGLAFTLVWLYVEILRIVFVILMNKDN